MRRLASVHSLLQRFTNKLHLALHNVAWHQCLPPHSNAKTSESFLWQLNARTDLRKASKLLNRTLNSNRYRYETCFVPSSSSSSSSFKRGSSMFHIALYRIVILHFKGSGSDLAVCIRRVRSCSQRHPPPWSVSPGGGTTVSWSARHRHFRELCNNMI